jgi:hypothetical protein
VPIFQACAIIDCRAQAVKQPAADSFRQESVKQITRGGSRLRYSCHGRRTLMSWTESMSTRRKIYWWFRFVVSGRFLETFLNLRARRGKSDSYKSDSYKSES